MKKRVISVLFIFITLYMSNKTNKQLSVSSSIKKISLNSLLEKKHHYRKTPIYEQKINEAGYLFEEHKIQTEDGYILTAWRIPGKIKEPKYQRVNKKPIILQHGLIDTSYTWILLDKDHALPFLLSDHGFDVWLTNTRGNAFSFEHVDSKHHDSSFTYSNYWDFSFHEMAIYDLPANIDYIKQYTGKDKVSYVSHSQGGLIYFILYSLRPEYLEKNIDSFFSLGTVATIFTAESKLIKYGSYFNLSKYLEKIRMKNLLCFNQGIYKIIGYFCRHMNSVCFSIVNFIISNNYNTHRIDTEKLFKDFFYAPGGTSSKNMHHWIQIYKSKKLAQFDYGEKKNYKVYNSRHPPEYDFSKFKNYNITSFLYVSNKDPFSNFDDLKYLTKYLENNSKVKIIKMNNYNHLDFLWSEDVKKDIYDKMISVLEGGS